MACRQARSLCKYKKDLSLCAPHRYQSGQGEEGRVLGERELLALASELSGLDDLCALRRIKDERLGRDVFIHHRGFEIEGVLVALRVEDDHAADL